MLIILYTITIFNIGIDSNRQQNRCKLKVQTLNGILNYCYRQFNTYAKYIMLWLITHMKHCTCKVSYENSSKLSNVQHRGLEDICFMQNKNSISLTFHTCMYTSKPSIARHFYYLQSFKKRCIGIFQFMTTIPSDRGSSMDSGCTT